MPHQIPKSKERASHPSFHAMNRCQPKILCVDDEPLNLDLLEAMLSCRGYELVRASSGTEALELIGRERIDICLLDVMMPGMDGYEVCRRIKADEERNNIPVVMMTAHADSENRIRAMEAGAEDFISKPVNAAEVVARIKMLLHVKVLNDRLNAAYHNIAKLSAFGEQMVNGFDPSNFDFTAKIDRIVRQLIRGASNSIGNPEIVVIGMIDQAGNCGWLLYDAISEAARRRSIEIDIDRKLAFATSDKPTITFENEIAADPAASMLAAELRKESISVANLVRYSNDSFCLLALNYGREVTTHDAAVLHNIVMQSLFLKSLASQARDTESAFEYTVLALARASEANDEDTGDHILRVGSYCALIAKEIGLPENFIDLIRIQAALHDVGKIQVSPAILKKTGALSADEWSEMKRHTVYGSAIIGGHQRMGIAGRIAISHHERFDGSGYPFGLSGTQIPIEGRILNLADQYDALRNARCYKRACDHETAFRIIADGDDRTRPGHFDPAVLGAFKALEGRFAEVYRSFPLRAPDFPCTMG